MFAADGCRLGFCLFAPDVAIRFDQRFEGSPSSYLYDWDGDGTFEDVTEAAGLLSFHPTQAATWFDFDGDGWLDLVTMNDGDIAGDDQSSRREHVFRNDGKGRFRDVTSAWWPPVRSPRRLRRLVRVHPVRASLSCLSAQSRTRMVACRHCLRS